MNIAELFINLGVKGGDKTLGTLSGMQKGLKDTASMSLEAKAALVGVFYAMERLFAGSNKRGTDLANFNATLGVSAQTLQRYQWAAQQVGVSNEAVAGSFKTLQSSMTKIMMGEGAPKGMARVAEVLRRAITQEDVQRWSRSPEELMKILQEYAQKETDKGRTNEVLESFGVGAIAPALVRNAFRPEVMNKAPTYSDGEIKALDASNAAWANLGTKIEMAVGHFNAKHGGEIVKNLSAMVEPVMKLASAFERLATKAGAFEGITKVFKGWILIFDGIVKAIQVIEDFTGKDKDKKAAVVDDAETVAYDAKNFAKETLASIAETLEELPGLFGELAREHMGNPLSAAPAPAQGTAAVPVKGAAVQAPGKPELRLVPSSTAAAMAVPVKPKVPPPPVVNNTTNKTEVTQTNTFTHDAQNPKATATEIGKATRSAVTQSPAQREQK